MAKTRFLFLMIILSSSTLFGQRISVNGTEFQANGERIWLNGTNTPWQKWNDFGGGFDYDWWDEEFEQLKEVHINCTRVWITCDCNNSSIIITDDGYIAGVNPLFWSHVDGLMEIAKEKEIYLMIALISFDHTKASNGLSYKWINMYNSETNRQSFVDNYAVPFVNRYKDNPYFFAVDVGNELDWVWENQGVSSTNVIDLVSRTVDGIHANSDVLACQGWGCGVKYNTSMHGCSGNYLANVNVDFYNIHFYDWQDRWFNNPFDKSPSYYSMDSKPCIVGEAPALGSAGYTPQQCYQKVFEQGWQGLMVWTSNGVDGNGDKTDSQPGTDWIYNHYPKLVVKVKDDRLAKPTGYHLYQNYPNPFNPSTNIEFDLPQAGNVSVNIYDVKGHLVHEVLDSFKEAGTYKIEWNSLAYSSGIYFCKIQSGSCDQTIKMVLQK